jgi:Lon protease-like protein
MSILVGLHTASIVRCADPYSDNDNGSMAAELLPLFPLSLVLLPGMKLPLHIFEERYREMMADVIPEDQEFGIVLAKEQGIVNVGCTATVQKVLHRYEDGRLDIVVAGRRRFEIESLDEEKSYLRAEIEFFDDDEDELEASTELKGKAVAAFRRLLAAGNPTRAAEPNPQNARLSFQIAELLADVDKRQLVLSLRSETERLEYLVKIVPEYLIEQEQIALAKRVAPLNGHAKHVITS